MRLLLSIVAFTVLSASDGTAEPQSTTPAATQAARTATTAADLDLVTETIKAAVAADSYPVGAKVGSTRAGDFFVLINGPLNRIAVVAKRMAREYRAFDPKEALSYYEGDRTVWVSVMPARPALLDGTWVKAPIPSEVLLQPIGARDPEHTVRARANEVKAESWQNAMGMTITGASITAKFDQDALMKVPGAFDLVILTDGNEMRYPISATQHGEIR